MPKITYVDPEGVSHTQDVDVGDSVMLGAFENDVPGILAQCGGGGACATCQVVVDAAWEGKVPPPNDIELSMLEEFHQEGVKRRLSCQIEVTESLDGLVVNVVENMF